MIKQYPESPMPEPYATYVKQRSEIIAHILSGIVGDQNIQLCPRAVTSREIVLDDAIIYGANVEQIEDGYKSVLYRDETNNGVSSINDIKIADYVQSQLSKGNRVRVKDARESDGAGQFTVDTVEDAIEAIDNLSVRQDAEVVLMPNLARIYDRISVGHISLGAHRNYCYVGREITTTDNTGREVYGGTDLGLYRAYDLEARDRVIESFDIDPELVKIGETTIQMYGAMCIQVGRVSIDVLNGKADNGDNIRSAVDVTPRVGGATPAEVLAIAAMRQALTTCYASSRLLYSPVSKPKSGINFIDSPELIINAEITGVQ